MTTSRRTRQPKAREQRRNGYVIKVNSEDQKPVVVTTVETPIFDAVVRERGNPL